MRRPPRTFFCIASLLLSACFASGSALAQQPVLTSATAHLGSEQSMHTITLSGSHVATPIFVAPEDSETLRVAANAFADDLRDLSGTRPRLVSALPEAPGVIILGTLGHSSVIDSLRQKKLLDTTAIEGKWESAVTAIVDNPAPGIKRALVIAGSDRRGAAYALFAISRSLGVSPWQWWADVPVQRHASILVSGSPLVQHEPSVKYRGIFLNDEDWGLRVWAANKMDPTLHNVGPRTYERIFELLLRLRANVLWPAMHPGTMAFNAVAEDAVLADKWGIVMGSSHSEALLRNNVGEWDEKRDGPWNYQVNRAAIDQYWDKRLRENGKFENVYTVGMRGVHDTGLEATGSNEVKARLVEEAMRSQRRMLAERVNPAVETIPQVIWLYKESLELYRAGMKVPDDVTLGWTDDNYGYLRQLSTASEQKRSGGSAIYYHVSYWGFPHDYLWLCTTSPALIREEMTKGFNHGARRLWVLNVGDLKPAEMDLDYFIQLAWDEPALAEESQLAFMQRWFAEQLPAAYAGQIASLMQQYYRLNFVRKPEFMGFNGYDDGVNRTDFNPRAWQDQNLTRARDWQRLSDEAGDLAKKMPPQYAAAFFELVQYPVQAAAAQNFKFLSTDRTFLDASAKQLGQLRDDAVRAQTSYETIQNLTARYNTLLDGKWDGMMSSRPRNREVFKMPVPATEADAARPLPAAWSTGAFAQHETISSPSVEHNGTISLNAAQYSSRNDAGGQWTTLSELGVTGSSLSWRSSGVSTSGPWVQYDVTTTSTGNATLRLLLLPTFPIDADHRLRFAVSIDGAVPIQQDMANLGEWHENVAPTWAANVLRNYASVALPLPNLQPGKHHIRLFYEDPAVVFEHLIIAFDGVAPGYPVAAEPPTR